MKMQKKVDASILALAALSVIGLYLFATAPADLNAEKGGGRMVPVEVLFKMLDAENASVRAIYTKEIVGPGIKAGLKFSEDWKKKDVHAGPLPALVLRETANRLQQRVPDLNLFLGSTFPIEASNKFKGAQLAYFDKIGDNQKPQFFLDDTTGRYTAMFADVASAPACVSCHNDHAKSPRKDWKLMDVMGATTWSYPRNMVSTDEIIEILAAYRSSAMETYEGYLKKTASFESEARPQLGERWPSDGPFLPDAQQFRTRVEERNSVTSLNTMLRIPTIAVDLTANPQTATAKSTQAVGAAL